MVASGYSFEREAGEGIRGVGTACAATKRQADKTIRPHLSKTVMKMSNLKLVVLFLALGLTTVIAAPRGWGDAHITYYGSPNGAGTEGGACGYQNTYKLGYGSMTAALSSRLFQGGKACGGCYQLRCAPNRGRNWCWSYARAIVVTATNLCPQGSHGGWCDYPKSHFDLPMPAFTSLARREGGVAPVWYRKVRCAKRGGVRFTIGGNPWFLMVLIHNVGGAGDVVSVKVKCPYTGWVSAYRNWGCLWTVRTKMTGPLSFTLVTSDGRTLYSMNAVRNGWKFGQTWEGSQFR
uniref:Expansin n=1 Tax=Physcomitrium patens TaxID=3218 RepID=A0A7I4EG08_PHYPA